ncbi:MAG: hypothetical protein COB73_01455 [Flavobacteriaceae bacterium]|nr:MAG: hypothetical protein COB73_01455 [Flavobacteriaceae bacterium]
MIKNLTVIITLIICVQGFAQKADSSPYSALGIGNEVHSKTVEEMSMGGVGTSGSINNQLSFSNPASYTSLKITRYTLSAENRAFRFKDETSSDNSSNAYLSYLAMGIPLGDKAGFAFGLQLNSTIGYTITENTFDANDELVQAGLYEGDGGTSRVFLGFGYEVFKNFSLGLEGKYIFGKTEKTIISQSRDVRLATKYKLEGSINGFGLKAGAIYKKEIKPSLFVNIGASVELENELDFNANEYLYSVSISGAESPRDTILSLDSKGIYKTPLKTNLGLSIGNPLKWSVMVDYSFRDAVDISGNLAGYNPKLEYEKSSKLSIGGYFIPKYNSISSYWDRISYRAGVRFENTGIKVNGSGTGSEFTSITDYGISFGLGLPVGKRYSKIDTSFEYGQMGTTSNGLTKETYFNFRVALAFGDKWFGRRQIN